MLVLIVGALIGVIAIHELAQFVLRSQGEPWYVRQVTLIFLPIALLRLNTIFSISDQLVCKSFGIAPFLPSQTAMCILIATELMWIALLE